MYAARARGEKEIENATMSDIFTIKFTQQRFQEKETASGREGLRGLMRGRSKNNQIASRHLQCMNMHRTNGN